MYNMLNFNIMGHTCIYSHQSNPKEDQIIAKVGTSLSQEKRVAYACISGRPLLQDMLCYYVVSRSIQVSGVIAVFVIIEWCAITVSCDHRNTACFMFYCFHALYMFVLTYFEQYLVDLCSAPKNFVTVSFGKLKVKLDVKITDH